jgi:predicted phosphodiesterase
MEHFNWKFNTGNKPLGIVVLGDIHLGAPEADIVFLKRIINMANKKGYYFILNGDLIDCGLRESPGASVYENKMNPRQQIEEIVNILKPISHKILSSTIGNHEARVLYNSSININSIIVSSIGGIVKDGLYQTMDSIKVGKEKYDLFHMHGASNAMTTEGRVNAFKKMIDIVEADIYCFSHCHDLHARKFIKNIITNNGVEEKIQTLVLCGNFLKQSPHAQLKGYPNLRMGAPLIKLYPNKHKIDVDLEWWEK